MKKTIALLLAALMLFGIAACGQTQTEAPAAAPAAEAVTEAVPEASAAELKPVAHTEVTLTGAELKDKVKLLGRAYADEKGLRCDWAASGFEFTADCEGELSFTTSTNGANYRYTVYIDGEEVDRQMSLEGDQRRVAKKDIPSGVHTIRIVRDSDNYKGKQTYFLSMTLNCDASTIAPTPDKSLLIEYIGDSITAGGGVRGDPTTEWSAACNAATQTYAYVSAELLNADYSVVAKGGIGALVATSDMTSQQLYECAVPFDAETKYECTREPDIIVLTLGANDKLSTRSDEFIEAMTAYVGTLREKHPNAKFVIAYSFMGNKTPDTFRKVWETLGGEEKGVYLFEGTVGTHGVPAKSEGTPHPNADDHRVNGEKLASFLREKNLVK